MYLQGISWEENEALFLAVLCALCGLLWRICMFMPGDRGKDAYRMEKMIWKTEKRGIGLFLLLTCLGIGGLCIGVQASQNSPELPVTIYNDSGCKLCIREESVYDL